ncbi:CDP-glycerol glycerophosphotransferase family protein [Anaerobacillus sp. CMMVII]|uniref:CDP-glycerol glycerophosphotransferase family protein n=1 Tax=Anaerobacillus sp. CMMVII TaxID=2755588 RepID=UPI0021B76511|nr:CDP-glycerol glycerophosphotransferase family protein [Anaerobacillus sp. CMMVII]MCT8140323.1 CDP-glycerol glycerophosphotransferase family protein [Anaerobacillus sp. CMMVII]
MAREIVISVYLLIFRMLFNVAKLFPQKEKTTFITSFGDNTFHVTKELLESYHGQVIILKTANCKTDFTAFEDVKIVDFETINFFATIKSIYHLATSKVVFVDNYFGCLSVMNFKENVVCVQLWHAAGAIKKFGLLDPSVANRSEKSKKRFKEVYKRFHYVAVGSEKMAKIFKASFEVTDETILRTGIPRTDFFFDKAAKEAVVAELKATYPVITTKKVILYAPTFRDGQLSSPEIAVDIKKMYEELKDEYVLFLRLHPAVKVNVELGDFDGFVYDVSKHQDINHLLLIADLLISDYSSIPFEYSLLEKPMIFHAYDLEPYSFSRGFWEDYKSNIPGVVTKTTDEVIEAVKANNFNYEKIRNYAKLWNQYSYGNSSKNLIMEIYQPSGDYGKLRDSM